MGFSLSDESATWEDVFRRETDRDVRRQILDKAEGDGLVEADEAALRRTFLDHRYDMVKRQKIDYFIRGWTRMSMLRKALIGHNKRSYESKELDQVLADWQTDRALANGALGRKVWYDELYNMARFYIQLCEEDKRYNSVMLGFGRIKKETREEKIAAEFRGMMYEIPRRLGREQDFAMFTKAAGDAFVDYFPRLEGLLREN